MDAAEMQRALARETEAMRHERELITAVRRGEAWVAAVCTAAARLSMAACWRGRGCGRVHVGVRACVRAGTQEVHAAWQRTLVYKVGRNKTPPEGWRRQHVALIVRRAWAAKKKAARAKAWRATELHGAVRHLDRGPPPPPPPPPPPRQILIDAAPPSEASSRAMTSPPTPTRTMLLPCGAITVSGT
jgi:hypothetical protein